MEKPCYQLEQVSMLIYRLERISADSIWARRASGLRGTLLKWAELYTHAALEDKPSLCESKNLIKVIEMCYTVLEQAARERIR